MSQKQDNLSIHSYLAQVTVERINIQIKFPCSVLASLKIGKQESFSKQAKLNNGIAQLSQRVQVKAELVYDNTTKQYSPKKVNRRPQEAAIYVHILSQTGRNTAGICSLDLVDIVTRTPYDVIKRPLERCPDHSAQIFYRVRLKFQEELPIGQVDNSFADIGKESEESNYGKSSQIIAREASQFSLMVTSSKPKLQQVSRLIPEVSGDIQKESPAYPIPSRLDKQTEGNWRSKVRLSSQYSRPVSNDVAQYSSNTSRVKVNNETMLEVEKRAARLQAQRDSQLKQMVNLNSQIESLRSQLFTKSTKQLQLTTEMEKLKRRAESQELQIDSLKKAQQKTGKLSEKVTEQFQQNISKLGDLQQQIRVLRAHRQIAEKTAKQKAREAQQLSERLQDITASQATLQKRLDMKDSFYKDQLKKYSQKLVESQLQKQKMHSDLQNIRGVCEDKERRIHNLLNQRDRIIQQQKSKLTKKYDLLREEYEKLATQRLTQRQQMLNSSSVIQRLKNINSEFSLQKIRLEEEIERLKNKLISESLQKNKYQSQLKEKTTNTKNEMLRQIQNDKKQKNQLLEALQRQINQKSEQNRQLLDKISDFQKRIKQKDIRVSDQDQEIDSLKKRNEAAKRSLEKKQQQWLNEQIHLKKQLQQYEKVSVQYESNIRKYKQQIDENQNRTTRLMAQLSQKSQLLGQLQNSSLRASTNSMRQEERIRKLNEENNSLTVQFNSLKASQAELLAKLRKTISQRDDIKLSHDLNSRLATQRQNLNTELQIQIDTFKRKISETQCLLEYERNNIQQLSNDLEQVTREKKQLAHNYLELEEKVQYLSTQLQNVKKQLKFGQQQLQQITSLWKKVEAEKTIMMEQISSERIMTKSLRQQNNNLSNQYYIVGQQAKQINKEFQIAQKQIIQLKRQQESLREQVVSAHISINQCQQKTISGLKFYSQLIMKENPINAADLDKLVKDCDIQISQILVHMLRKDNERKNQADEKYKIAQEAARQLNDQLTQAKDQLTQLNEQIISIEIELNQKQQQNKSAQINFKLKQEGFEVQLQNMIEEQNNLDQNIRSLQQRLQISEENFDKLENQKSQFHKRLNEALHQSSQLRSDLQHSFNKIQYLQSQIHSANLQLNSENKSFIEFRDKNLAEQSDLQKQVQSLKAKLQNQTIKFQQFQIKESEVIKLKSEIQNLKDILANKNEQIYKYSIQIEELQEKLKSILKKQKQLQQKIDLLNLKILDQQAVINESQFNSIKLESKSRDTQELFKANDKQRQALVKRLTELQAQFQNQEFMINNLRRDIETQKLQTQACTTKLKNKDIELKLYLQELIHRQQQLDEMTQQLNKLKGTNSRLSRDIEEKNNQMTEISQLNSSELKSLLQQFESLNAEYNLMKQHLEQQQNTIQGLKAAFEKQKEQWKYKQEILNQQIMELNEQLYSISSDINTMRLKQQEDQQNMEKIQHENDRLLNLFAAEKKKNQILNLNSQKNLLSQKKIQQLQRQIQQLKSEIIKKAEHIQKVTSQNFNLQQQINDNSLVKDFQEKYENMARSYQQQLMVLQEMLNRERSDFQSLRRQYHHKCIGYQQKIRTLEIQFRANRDNEERLDTIQEQKSSNPPSQIGKCPSENPLTLNSSDDEVTRLTREIQHKNSDIMIYEQQIRQMEETIAKLETSVSIHSGDLEAMQSEIKKLVSMKIHQTQSIHEMTNIVNRIKAKSLTYSRLPAQNKDLMSQFKLLNSKISEILQYNKQFPQFEEVGWHESRSPTQSTDIVESSSLNDLGRNQDIIPLQQSASLKQSQIQKMMQKNRS